MCLNVEKTSTVLNKKQALFFLFAFLIHLEKTVLIPSITILLASIATVNERSYTQ